MGITNKNYVMALYINKYIIHEYQLIIINLINLSSYRAFLKSIIQKVIDFNNALFDDELIMF